MGAIEFCEPEFYKLVTKVTCDDNSQNIYTVPIGRWNQQTSVEEPKSELNITGESISKKEVSKIS